MWAIVFFLFEWGIMITQGKDRDLSSAMEQEMW